MGWSETIQQPRKPWIFPLQQLKLS
jgi:hypothetical protein